MNNDNIIEELSKKECTVRWKEGVMPVVCGAPYPCSLHTSREERKEFFQEVHTSADQAGYIRAMGEVREWAEKEEWLNKGDLLNFISSK